MSFFNIPLFKWIVQDIKRRRSKHLIEDVIQDADTQQEEEAEEEEQIETHYNGVKLIYFVSTTEDQNTIDVLRKSYKDIQIFNYEYKCLQYIKSLTDKVILIIDDEPSITLIESIEPLKQIDSVFFYSPPSGMIREICGKQHTYIHELCENYTKLENAINRSREEVHQQKTLLNMYNKEEKKVYYIPKDQISFLHFQLCKLGLKIISGLAGAKNIMIKLCRSYYRGNTTELANIDAFDQTYQSSDAIAWYTKENFLRTLINRTFRTKNYAILFSLGFFISNLNKQLEFECKKLREKQKDILKLYRSEILSQDELMNYQNNIGNLISNTEYLSTSSKRSIADNYLTKLYKEKGFIRVLIEYTVDLNVVKNIVIADVEQYSPFPDDGQFIIDTGALFQINSCKYNTEEDLWHIELNATDKGAEVITHYLDFLVETMTKSNKILMFGNFLVEIGEYIQAERYFDTVLGELYLNDDEIASIYFYFGRLNRMKGDLKRAIVCFNRAYKLLINAGPKRIASAGKAMNRLGAVYSEQGEQTKANECFERAMHLYKNSSEKDHVDVAGLLINLGIMEYKRENFKQALNKYQTAMKIYERSLPSFHPNLVIARINIGNVHLANKNYQMALEVYETALKILEATLSANHMYIWRTLHNLSILYARQENMDEANKYLERAQNIVDEVSPLKHIVLTLNDKTNDFYIN